MVEYVYAQRDFVAEYEGEIAFRAGERIEVIEKDEHYDDGWWEGRNLAGEVGLFPKSHIQPARPRTEPPRALVPATAPLSLALADKAQPSIVPIPSIKQPRLQTVQEGTNTSEEEEVDITAPHRQVDQKFASIQPSERYIVPSMVPLPESGIIQDNASETTTVATPTQPLFSWNETVRTLENNNSLLSPVLPGLRGIFNRVSANQPSSAPLVLSSETLGLQEVVDIRSIPSHFHSGHGDGLTSRSSVATSDFITNSSLFSAPTSPRSTDFIYTPVHTPTRGSLADPGVSKAADSDVMVGLGAPQRWGKRSDWLASVGICEWD